jgi:hypothetical protein
MDAVTYLMQVLQELRALPEGKRRIRMQALTKPVLIQIAEVLLRKLERETSRNVIEIEKRDFHIERLESMLEPKDTLTEESSKPVQIEKAKAKHKSIATPRQAADGG